MFHVLLANEEVAAAAAGTSASGVGALFEALGLNIQSLIVNSVAFLLVVWVMAKWVFPPLTKALDAKRDELDAALRLEREASTKLDEAKAQAGKLIEQARLEANEVLAAAKSDATTQLEAAHKKAAAAAERSVQEAREQLARDVLTARRDLKAETAKLVASATEAVLNEKLDDDRDGKLIAKSLERANG